MTLHKQDEVINIISVVRNRNCVIIDDMVDIADTLYGCMRTKEK